MRTRTTTREGTRNRELNYPLKLFIWKKLQTNTDFKEAYENIKQIELLKVIKKGQDITSDPQVIQEINNYING
uniref:Uncharacterized protein n=1 Tax=viral metagenome TaxID=1070528 RepID=A0A6C0JVK3_9ZZZZ